MKALSKAKFIFLIALCFFALVLTACKGVEIAPGDGGSVTVKPIDPDDNSSDNGGNNNTVIPEQPKDDEIIHTHTYSSVDSSGTTDSCTQDSVVVYRCSCGDEITETVKAPGHEIRSYEGKAATCEQSGYEAYQKCIRGNCTYTTYKTIPALDHNFVTLANIEPTCTTDGAYDRVRCMRSGCNYSTGTVVSSLGHVTKTVPGTQPTCTESGSTSYEICTRSGCNTNLTNPEVIAPLGHNLQYFEGKEATCTEFGWNDYSRCQRCEDNNYTVIPAKGHTLENGYCDCGYQDLGQHQHIWNSGETVVSATCTANGMMKYTCTDENCRGSKTESIAPLGHTLSYYGAKDATCTEAGHYAYEECNVCAYTTYVKIPPLDHSFTSGVITTYPTCTLPGIRTYYCRCGMGRDVEIEKLGHDFGEWSVSLNPTCTTAGKEKRTCRNGCGYVEEKTITALGHDWSEWYTVETATCTKEGITKRSCNNDPAHEEKRLLPKTDHKISPLTGICSECDVFVGERLATPSGSVTEATFMWVPVEGADHYELTVDGETIKTTATRIDLEQYYGNYNTLQLTVRAIPAEGSEIYNSEMFYYEYQIPGEPLSNIKGVGDAVNLLNGTYTEFAGGTTRIWNENLFRRLRAEDKTTVHGYQVAEVLYSTSISGYVNQLTESFSNKTSVSVSAGFAGIAKVTAGFSFGVGKDYKKKTQNETQVVFYDMDYKYVDRSVEIYGYNDKSKLSSMLSDDFLLDAAKVQNREMTAEEFILKYGTHIVTAGTYGAKFNLHYEMLTTKEIAEETFGENIEVGINAEIQGSIGAVNLGLGVENVTSTKQEAFTSTTNENMQTKFVAKAIGGNATGMVATSLSQFSEICENWAAGLEESNNYVLIDVPNNSLFFVWDFLGDEYAETKNILNTYFYACCDENYYNLKDKVSSIYQDSLTYDETDGTLTVNLSGLQNYNSANLSALEYKVDDNTYIFNSETGKFTVFSKYYGKDVNKVIFVGSYGTEDDLGRLITTKFTKLRIYFDANWNKDIVVEFQNFGFEAPNDYTALHLRDVSSENATIIVSGAVYIKGGDGLNDGNSAYLGINAKGINLTITGTGDLEIHGGNGKSGSSDDKNGGSGGNGGVGIEANEITVNLTGNMTVYGGNGGSGAAGDDGSDGSGNDSPGSSGGNGGNGGLGASAILCSSISANSTVNAIAGNGGNGGRGGDGGDGTRDSAPWSDGKNKGGRGGNGGNGGACGDAVVSSNSDWDNINCTAGTLGTGGRGGDGGNGGPGNTSFAGGPGGDGGAGGTGGLNGDGTTRASNGNPGKQGS